MKSSEMMTAESKQFKIKTHIEELKEVISNNSHLLNNITYECGSLGLSLFCCYYGIYSKDSSYIDEAKKYFDKSINFVNIEKFERIYSTDSIDNHLSNLGRFLCFIVKNNLSFTDEAYYFDKLDTILSDLMKTKILRGDFDYNSGALAAGYYFVNRLDLNPSVCAYLTELVFGLNDKAVKDENDDYYWPSPSLHNNTYLGLSHGSAMVISFLSTLMNYGIEVPLCKEIIHKASSFLINNFRKTKYGHFPVNTQDDVFSEKAFCICYGDIGIAYALLKANIYLKNEKISSIVGVILEECLERKRSNVFPPDASITYGASGLAEFFNKLYVITSDYRFKEASCYWQEEILSYSIHPGALGGYQSMTSKEIDFWNMSFGWGVIGIAVVLMRHLDPTLPSLTSLLMIA